MKRLLLAIFVSLFTTGSASAKNACESKAVGSDGKRSLRARKGKLLEWMQGRCVRKQCSRWRGQAARGCGEGKHPQDRVRTTAARLRI
jgi:hypothetical protein